MTKHNNPADPFHFKLYDFLVLGSEIVAARDIVRITFSSMWMLLNALRAIIAGWGFQLNGDVTGKVCRVSIDVLEFGVNSIPKRNNVLCLAIIPKSTESEKVYTITWDDLREGVLTALTYKHCGDAECSCCGLVMELIRHVEVQKFLRSQRFRRRELPVETSMCDNFKGWGNFSENVLGIDANICLPHATGTLSKLIIYYQHSDRSARRYSCR
jgi:hypothetical protein